MFVTPSYAKTTNDPYEIWANLAEWVQRENLYLAAHPESSPDKSLIEMPYARDAGDVCGVCGELVTWVDHLPPVSLGKPVRCMKNVTYVRVPTNTSGPGFALVSRDVEIDDIFVKVPGIETPVFRAKVENTDEEERSFRESFGYAVNDPKHPDFHDTYADYADMERD